MTVLDAPADAPIAHALLDGEGRLLSADPALKTLNERAGGAFGAMLAVPQLAALARLSRRLGIVVSRSVVVAGDEADVALWVRVQPEGDGLRLAASGWREGRPWRSAPRIDEARRDLAQVDAAWRWETDAALRITFVSLDAGPRWGFDPFAVLGQPLTVLFSLKADGDEGLPILDALAERRSLVAQPAVVRASNRPVVLSAAVRHDGNGAFAGFVGGVRKRALAPRAEAEPLSPMLMGQVGAALRTPLGRIIANADDIHAQTEGPISSDYADYAADIASAGRHLLSLIDDLVDVQGIEQPDFTPIAEEIDLADLARRAAGLLSVRASSAGVTIVRPGPESALVALGDFRRTLQILVNLIGNAVRYAPADSEVTVELGRADALAMVTVSDRGKGVAIEDQARIFNKFERVDTSEPDGNGLGLYIARWLARAMGGDVTVKSAAGSGARFTLSLRALPADAAGGKDE